MSVYNTKAVARSSYVNNLQNISKIKEIHFGLGSIRTREVTKFIHLMSNE